MPTITTARLSDCCQRPVMLLPDEKGGNNYYCWKCQKECNTVAINKSESEVDTWPH